MQDRAPFIFRETSTDNTAANRPGRHFTSDQRRTIFKGMVVGELEAGFLRYSKRQVLLKYAANLNIPEFEACLLMAEAQYRADSIEPVEISTAKIISQIDQPSSSSLPLRLGMALMAAIFIDLMLILWIL